MLQLIRLHFTTTNSVHAPGHFSFVLVTVFAFCAFRSSICRTQYMRVHFSWEVWVFSYDDSYKLEWNFEFYLVKSRVFMSTSNGIHLSSVLIVLTVLTWTAEADKCYTQLTASTIKDIQTCGLLTEEFYIVKKICYRRESKSISSRGKLVCSFCWCSFHLLAFIAFFLFFVFLQVPLISCASPWRAGETKNGASPKLKTLLR
jgi:hypothetical protein